MSRPISPMGDADEFIPPSNPNAPFPAPATAITSRGRNSNHRHSASDLGGRVRETLENPGTVRINVRGAYIVNDEEIKERSPSEKESGNGSGTTYHATEDIRLPHHIERVSHVAVDIGGSLAKLVYFTKEVDASEDGGRLNFVNFETNNIDECIEFIRQLQEKHMKAAGTPPQDLCIVATGGGAFKYHDRLKEELGTNILREEEMECLIIGLDFFITEIPNEIFTYSETDPMRFAPARPDVYPYLLVNIGSGVSMVKVTGPRQFTRVGGTSLGGGTFWGITSLLTGVKSFDKMLQLADEGDNAGVDMLVGDIYGTDYNKIGLKKTAIASTFGKVFKTKRLREGFRERNGSEESLESPGSPSSDKPDFSIEDMSRSLLFAISNNIGQIAYLQSEKHDIRHIYFGGSFIRGHSQTMNTLSYAINFWSNGEKQAYFLRHEGYLGAVGAFLKRQPPEFGRRRSVEDFRTPQPKSTAGATETTS
ncbi:pantothenate kinase [Ascosphaera apis ARSEF 7405]|uniref:Pantothenate kinase n=1 Tax=Ascosphaera apis ARSEF 7405 TaxID=392613 RepID=A0A167VLK0_9EURO|nr:pantothenate kinase [Ascosphaera apis ARSEF 7405]